MKRCMYCGQENDDANETCVKCGNHLLDTPVEDAAPIEEVPDEEAPDADGAKTAAGEGPEDLQLDRGAGTDLGDDAEPSRDLSYAVRPQVNEEDFTQPYDRRGYGYGSQEQPERSYSVRDDYDDYGEEPQYSRQEDDERAPMSMTPLMKAARKRVKSFLFLLATLFFTIHVAANVVNIVLDNALTNLSTVSNTLGKQFGANSALTLLNTVIGLLKGVNHWALLGVSLGLMLPSFLLMFGLWMMFTGTDKRRVPMSAAGYSLSRGAVILQFIIACVAILAIIVLTVSFVVAAGASGSTMSLIVGIVLLLVVVILSVLTIMFYIQVIFSLKLIKKNAVTGEDIGRIPGYAVFIGFLSCLGTVAAMLPMAPDDYIGLTVKGAYAAWLLLISIWALIYKATVKVR